MRWRPVLLLVAFALAGCDSEPPRPTSPRAAARPSSSARGDFTWDAEAPLDPPPPVGDLRAEIEGFTTLEACVRARAEIDPLLGDGLQALGYDTFLRDACRVLEASKLRDVRRCEAIEASPLRARCATLAAVVTSDPDACPWDSPARPTAGRDPVCLALAARDPRLCAAADLVRRPTCEALSAADPKPCESLALESERASCRREVGRLAPVLTAASGEKLAAKKNAWAVLKLTALAGAPKPRDPEVNATPDIAQGLVVLEQEGGVRISIGRPTDASVRRFGAPENARPTIALTVFLGPSGKAPKIERCELSMPGAPPLAGEVGTAGIMLGDACELKVQVQRVERARGGDVKLTFDGVIGASPRGYEVHFDFATFVRDVITAKALVAAESPLPRPVERADAGAPR